MCASVVVVVSMPPGSGGGSWGEAGAQVARRSGACVLVTMTKCCGVALAMWLPSHHHCNPPNKHHHEVTPQLLCKAQHMAGSNPRTGTPTAKLLRSWQGEPIVAYNCGMLCCSSQKNHHISSTTVSMPGQRCMLKLPTHHHIAPHTACYTNNNKSCSLSDLARQRLQDHTLRTRTHIKTQACDHWVDHIMNRQGTTAGYRCLWGHAAWLVVRAPHPVRGNKECKRHMSACLCMSCGSSTTAANCAL